MAVTSIFLSYARDDDESFARQLYQDLDGAGHRVWFDRESMPSRALTFLQEIRDAIESSERLVLVLGPKAIASDYVRAEWEHALLFGNSVIPILRLGSYDTVPPEISKLHTPDFRASRPYPEALRELLRILDEKLLPLAPLYGVPSFPPHFIPRIEDLSAINAEVLADAQKPVVVSSHQRTTALLGMGGVGKTVLAIGFARATETRRAFVDGIVWVSMGRGRDAMTALRLIGSAFGDQTMNLDLESAKLKLATILQPRVSLIILDDVWDVEQVEPVVDCMGPRGRLLMTTREGALASALGGQEHLLDIMPPAGALRLLAQWAGADVAALARTEAAEVAGECGNLPFALALCGAMVRDGVSWQDVRTALANADLSFVSRRLPGYPYPDVFRSLQASVLWLRASAPDDANRYGELAVFPQGEEIPECAVATLWAHSAGVDDLKTRKLIVTLERKALITLHGAEPERRVRLHDLQHDYLRSVSNDVPALHRQLLAAYAGRTPTGWESAPNDGYYLEHVVYHHIQSGARLALAELLTNLSFLETKAGAGMAFDLVSDFTAALEFLEHDPAAAHPLRIVAEALRIDLPLIARHSAMLFQCCWNRIWWYDNPAADAHYVYPEGPAGVGVLPAGPRGLSALMESWRDERMARSPGSLWLRSHRPPPVRLGSPLRAKLGGSLMAVRGLAFSPNGRELASGDWRALRIFDVATGRERMSLPGADILLSGPTHVAYSPDGRFIVTSEYIHPASSDSSGGRLRIVDAGDGHEIATVFDGGDITSAAYSPDGTRIAVGRGDGRVRVWNALTLEPTLDIPGGGRSLGAVTFSPDGRQLATSSPNQTAVILDIATGGCLLAITPEHSWSAGLAYSPDGRLLALGTYQTVRESFDRVGSVEIFDARTGAMVRRFEGHRSEVKCVAFAPDGGSVASGGNDYTVRIWDLQSGNERMRIDTEQRTLQCLAYSPDGRLLAAGSSEGTLWIWDVAGPNASGNLVGHDEWISSLHFSPDGARLATTSDDATVRLWDVESGLQFKVMCEPAKWTRSARYSSDGKWIAAASGDGTVRVWDAITGDEVHVLLGHGKWVNSVAFSPDSRILASGASDCTIRLWNAASGELIRVLTSSQSDIQHVAFSRDGARILSAHIDELYYHALVWDVDSGVVLSSTEDRQIQREFEPPAAASGQWEWHENSVRELATGRDVAWFQEEGALSHADHPSGRIWAIASGRNLYIVSLEGVDQLNRSIACIE